MIHTLLRSNGEGQVIVINEANVVKVSGAYVNSARVTKGAPPTPLKKRLEPQPLVTQEPFLVVSPPLSTQPSNRCANGHD